MFKAFSLLLLILVLNIQLYSSAPIPGEFVQPSVVAEEPEEVAGKEGGYPGECIQEKLIPIVAEVSATSSAVKLTSEEGTVEKDIPAIAKDPKPVVTTDQVTVDNDKIVSQETAAQEPLAADVQASSVEEPALVQPAFAEVSPGSTVEVAPAVAVDSESPEQRILEDQTPAGTVRKPTASQKPAPAEVETKEKGQVDPEQSGPEVPNVTLDPEEPAQHEPEQPRTVPIISSQANQEEDIEEHAEDVKTTVLVVVEENAEEPLPSATEQEESVVLVPVELDSKEEGQQETKPQESALRDQVVIAGCRCPPVIKTATKEHAKEAEAADPIVLEGDTEEDLATSQHVPPEEEESDVLFPAELETEDGGQEEPAGEETVPQELAPEDKVDTTLVEGDADLEGEVEEESIPIVSPEAPEEETQEENTKVEAAATADSSTLLVSLVSEENAEEEPSIDKEPEEEKYITPFPSEIDSKEERQEKTVPQESAPEELVVLVEPSSEEPEGNHMKTGEETVTQASAPEDKVVIAGCHGPSETETEEAPEEHAKEVEAADPTDLEGDTEEDPATKKDLPSEEEPAILVVVEEHAQEPLPNATKQDDSVVLVPVELDSKEEGQQETKPQESALRDQVVIAGCRCPPIIKTATKEHAKEAEAADPIVLEGDTEEDPATSKHIPPEEEESDVLSPVELETEDEGQEEPAAEETVTHELAPEDPVVVVPVEMSSEEPGGDQEKPVAEETEPQESASEELAVVVLVEPTSEKIEGDEVKLAPEETVPQESAPENQVVIAGCHCPSETEIEEVPEEHAKEVEAAEAEGDTEEDPATNKDLPPEEESDVLFPVELETEDEGQEEPVAEETEPQEPATEEPAAVVLVESASEKIEGDEVKPAPEETVPQESAPEDQVVIAGCHCPSETEEAPEEHAKDVEVADPTVLEGNTEEDPATNKDLPPEEESVILFPAELETEDGGQEEPAAEETEPQESGPEEPVVVLLEPTSEKPAPNDPILIFPLEDSEDGPEDNTVEGTEAPDHSDLLPHNPALEEDATPQEIEPNGNPVILTISVTETPSESEFIKEVLVPVEGVIAAATEVFTEVPAITDAEVESVLAALEDSGGTKIRTHKDDVRADIIVIKEEPIALVSRGAVLGAAFFTLMSFIIIGYILMTVSKKLR